MDKYVYNPRTGLTVSSNMCRMEDVRQRRTHRKNRINKKWRKHYGMIQACHNDAVYHVTGSLYVCPCTAAKIEKSTNIECQMSTVYSNLLKEGGNPLAFSFVPGE